MYHRLPTTRQPMIHTIFLYQYYFQPRADAPSTAASAPGREDLSTFTLSFHKNTTFSFILLRIGSSRSSPALARPPKRIIASGAEKAIKLQKASPRTAPVNSGSKNLRAFE